MASVHIVSQSSEWWGAHHNNNDNNNNNDKASKMSIINTQDNNLNSESVDFDFFAIQNEPKFGSTKMSKPDTNNISSSKANHQPILLSEMSEKKKLIDFSNKVYVAPLTTVGNLPYRRIMKLFGADITCGEMAIATNILQGSTSEWSLLRRHPSEDIFGVQIAGSFPDQMARCGEIIAAETNVDFIDINMGCPLDLVCNKGAGSSLMLKSERLHGIVKDLGKICTEAGINLTLKMRTGWDSNKPIAHNIMPKIQKIVYENNLNVPVMMIHGRSRLQRYSKLADWHYIYKAANSQNPNLPKIPIVGNGDILSFEDHERHIMEAKLLSELKDDEDVNNILSSMKPIDLSSSSSISEKEPIISSCAMLARGALIKPWLPTEIKERRHWDISSSERFDMLKDFVNFGLEHWGSDTRGVNTTRRFLLEWLSFLYRYVPVGLLEVTPQYINERTSSKFVGRDDLETLMASNLPQDWVKISELLLGKVPEGFKFTAKHNAKSHTIA